ncbi:MAG: hypothetical protein DWP92_11280 [Armatimonadetes bacterium]|nr:MAG: hypothetical protein DWP92_11280 [Armatimonadota bacterium]
MLPITLVETDRDDFDGPIVEFWRGEDFVGMVFYDGEETIVQFFPDADGDVQDLAVAELQALLDTALRIVDPDALDDELGALREAAGSTDWDEEHPATVELLGEFDARAAHRSDDGEGFFPRSLAQSFIARCEELDLAVVEMEGFSFADGELVAVPDLDLAVTPQSMMSWSQFRTYANSTASNALATWPDRESIVVAFVFQQPDEEIIVA